MAFLKEVIHSYTGLSPLVFFTTLALALATYQVFSGWFSSPFDRHQRARSSAQGETTQPVQVGEITEEELKQYDGSDPQKPILMAIKHQIYDVTQSRDGYDTRVDNPKLAQKSLIISKRKKKQKTKILSPKTQRFVVILRVFYGPGGPYALFTGKDASRALAKMSMDDEDFTSDITGLGPFELEVLQDWENKFMSKYAKVGTIRVTSTISEAGTVSVSGPA